MTNHRTGSIHIVYASTDTKAAYRLSVELQTLELGAWIHRHELSTASTQAMLEVLRNIPSACYLIFLISRHSLPLARDSSAWISAVSTNAILLLPLLVDFIEPDDLLLELRERTFYDGNLLSNITSTTGTSFRIDPDSAVRPVPTDPRRGTGIASLLQRELDPALPVDSTRASKSMLQGISRRHLRLIAMHCIDDLAFQSFLFDAEISSDEINGKTLHEKLVLLLSRLHSIGVIEQFADWLERERRSCVAAQLELLRSEEIWQLPQVTRFAGSQSETGPKGRLGWRATLWGSSAVGFCAALGVRLLVDRHPSGTGLPIEERSNTPVRAASRALKPLLPNSPNDQLVPEWKHFAVLFASMLYDDPRWPRLTTPANDGRNSAQDSRAGGAQVCSR